MSKRIWIGLIVCLGAASAYAGPEQSAAPESEPAMRLGDSSWYLYRPDPRSPAIYDLDYMVEGLRSDVPGYSLRFSDSLDFAFELKFAPLMDRNDFIGPVYDSDIGATQLVFSFRF
jgi:hypothetical protein